MNFGIDSAAEIDRMAELYGHSSADSRIEQLRVPPQSVEAEQAVLGGLMLAPESLPKISDWIEPENFYRRDHQLIYRAILELAEMKPPRPFDPVTLGEWFESQGLSEQVAGGAYLIELASTTPSAANIVAYAEIVRDKALLRQVIELCTGGVNLGFQPGGRDTRDIIAELQRDIALLAGNPRAGGSKSMLEVGNAWFEALQCRYADKGKMLGLPTPWAAFNALTGGLIAGDLVILAGRPGMGKSAWAINVATANALSKKRVLFFNLEMTAVSIFNRAVASIGDVPLAWLRRPVDDDPESDTYWTRVASGVGQLKGAGLVIDDTPALRLEQVIARARREHMRQPLDLIIIDHLHIMPLPGKTRETVEIGHITAALKALAKELGCCVLLLSQLNRSLEVRVNKRPVMKDLRESGNIEQDADLIVFIYRDDYYAEQEGRLSEFPGGVEMIIAKQREGETGKVWAKSALAYGRIDDFDGPPPVSQMLQSHGRKSKFGSRGRDAAAGES
jgi:replicative DNA helicase